MNGIDVHQLAAAYALDAVDGNERGGVRGPLPDVPRVQARGGRVPRDAVASCSGICSDTTRFVES